MQVSGVLRQLDHSYDHPIRYTLSLDGGDILLNDLLETPVTITFGNRIQCIACGREIKRTYNNGYCYPCFRDLPENDLCIVKPSQCHFHQGTCRDSEWGQKHCMQPHYVYLAVSSNVKVGLTRKDNEIRRWTDQGEVRAFTIAELPTRKLAGELELVLSKYIDDKTDWRKMLKDDVPDVDLQAVRNKLIEKIPQRFIQYLLPQQKPVELSYPLAQPATKLKSFDLTKQPVIHGTLVGIKGQYLILDNGVFNVRKHSGFHLTFSFEASGANAASNL